MSVDTLVRARSGEADANRLSVLVGGATPEEASDVQDALRSAVVQMEPQLLDEVFELRCESL